MIDIILSLVLIIYFKKLRDNSIRKTVNNKKVFVLFRVVTKVYIKAIKEKF